MVSCYRDHGVDKRPGLSVRPSIRLGYIYVYSIIYTVVVSRSKALRVSERLLAISNKSIYSCLPFILLYCFLCFLYDLDVHCCHPDLQYYDEIVLMSTHRVEKMLFFKYNIGINYI